MEVYEKINQLLEEQNITKREFARRLREIEPKLKSTGEIPTEKAIYGYLNGSSSIKIELIPYIAETLQITEQELFFTTYDKRVDFFRKMVSMATDEELEVIKERLSLKYKIDDILNSYDKTTSHSKNKEDDETQKLINLLPYCPKPLMQSLIFKLEDLKKFTRVV